MAKFDWTITPQESHMGERPLRHSQGAAQDRLLGGPHFDMFLGCLLSAASCFFHALANRDKPLVLC